MKFARNICQRLLLLLYKQLLNSLSKVDHSGQSNINKELFDIRAYSVTSRPKMIAVNSYERPKFSQKIIKRIFFCFINF